MIRPILAAAASAVLLGTAALSLSRPAPAVTKESTGPRYDTAGRLIFPSDYRDWVFLSSGLDMNYSEAGAKPAAHVFGNVFAARGAYRVFETTGHWPDKMVLIVENRAGSTTGSINKSGQFQAGAPIAIEAHVRDVARFKGGWGFFAFDGVKPAGRIGYEASCYSCHRTNAAVETTFVQFYPTLLPIAIAHGSLDRAYRADVAAAVR